MKLFFDQNISFRILKEIKNYFPGSNQVVRIGLENYSDTEILNYARQNSYSIVTFDSDFADLVNIRGIPPKIIWIRTGNTSTKNLIELLKKHKKSILDFLHLEEFKNISCLEIE